MKIFVIITRTVFVICVPVMLLTAVIAGAVNSSWLYTHGFEKYDVRQGLADNGLNLSDADMAQIARGFIHYFNSGEEYINLTVQQNNETVALFNTEEIIHFKDVKKLFRFDYNVLLGTFCYCLVFSLVNIFWRKGKYRPNVAADVIKGSFLTFGLMLLLGIGTIVDFNDLFYRFHLLVFTNTFWSAEGNMLLLFPDGFWYDAAIYCVVAIALLAVILGGVSWGYLHFRGKKERKDRLLQN